MRPQLKIVFLSSVAVVGLACGLFGSANEFDYCDTSVSVDGTASVDGRGIDFDSSDPFISYSESAGDDACIYEAHLTVYKGGQLSNCSLSVTTTPLLDGSGRLRIDRFDLGIDASKCPTWMAPDGDYDASRADGEIGTVAFGSSIEAGEDSSCYEGDITIDLVAFQATALTGEAVAIGASTITLSGTVFPLGDMASCATPG